MQAHRWWLVAVVAAVVGFRAGHRAWARPTPPAAAKTSAAPADGKRSSVPAPRVSDDEGIEFPVVTTRSTDPAGRRIRIRIGGGEATLTLFDSPRREAADPNGFAFGRGVLEAAGGGRGAGVVKEIGAWLGEPGPPPRAGELRPFHLSYVRLGSEGDWEANKLFLQDGALSAEVFLNLRKDGKSARLVEKDEEYREPLLALLALALRDGRAPRQTPATDPRFASARPLVTALAPIAGMTGSVVAEAWVGGRWAAVTSEGRNRVLLWDQLDKPPRRLVEVAAGEIAGLQPSPRSDRLGLKVLHPRTAGGLSSDDPGEVLVVDLTGGAPRSLVASSGAFRVGMLSAVIWAPDGHALAVAGQGAGKPGTPTIRLYDPADGRQVGAGHWNLLGWPVRWEAGGLWLEEWLAPRANDPRQAPVRRAWRWQPGRGDPKPVRATDAVSELRSPDGRFTVRLAAAALQIAGGGRSRSFALRGHLERLWLEGLREDSNLAAWFGPMGLVLTGDADVVLDLETLKLRYLLPDGSARLVSACSTDGRVIARDETGTLSWGAGPSTRSTTAR